MASNAALMIKWGLPRQGREFRALEEFMAHTQYWAEIKAKGEIADYRVYGPTTGNMELSAGFVILEGTTAQIDKYRSNEAFRTRLDRVNIVAQNVSVEQLEMGDGMAQRMQRYGTSLKEVKI